MELRKNILLNNRYRIIKTISSEGGFSYVYLSRDIIERKRVAIKELFPKGIVERNGLNVDVKNREKFDDICEEYLLEVNILKELNHKGVIEYLDFFFENSTCYMVYSYEKGRNLKEYVEEKNHLHINESKAIFEKITSILEYIHERGILHRDIKPSNIMVSKEKVVLLDFGSATYVNRRFDKYLKVSKGYSPIELYSLESKQSYSTDIYSLFATLYYMLEGKALKSSPKRFFEEDVVLGRIDDMRWKELIVKNLAVDAKNRSSSIEELRESFRSR